MSSRIDNFIIRQADDSVRFANSLVLGDGLTLTDTAGGIPELRDSFVGAKLSLSSSIPLPANTQVMLSFDVVSLDSHEFWTASAPTRLTIPEGAAGVYQVVTQAMFGGGNPGTRASGAVRNGTERVSLAASQEPGGLVSVTATQIVRLEEGDYLEMGVFQEAGANIQIEGVQPEQTSFILLRVGV